MSDSEKPKSWKERRQSIKHKWAVPFVYVEWKCKQLSKLLDQWAFLDILGHAGRFTVLVAVIFYIVGCPERQRQAKNQRKAKHYQAWQVINATTGRQHSGGRKNALQDLNEDKVLLTCLDISKAHLPNLDLQNAELSSANLTEAEIHHSNLSGANLYKANLTGAILWAGNFTGTNFRDANLTGANLYGADFTGAKLHDTNLTEASLLEVNLTDAMFWRTNLQNIRNWQDIKSIERAMIYDVNNPPDGFIEWAFEHGAIIVEDDEE